MEHEKKKGYHEAIAALANALELSSKLFHKGDKEAEASIRREAESLKASGEAYGDPEIAGMGTELMEAERKELPLVIESVIQSLRERVQTVSEEEKADILIVDDDRTITHILRHKLSSENRRLHFAATAADAKAILDKTEVSLILLDLFLPDADGRSVLVQLREIPNTATIPIIVLSGHSEGATKTECFALGATDFFEKPFDPDTLAAAVASGLHRAQELSRDVRQDSLTQIPNRAAFGAIFERMRSFANRVGAPLCIAMIDLDNFKSVNDTYGRTMGDEVLKRVAFVMSRSLRRYDSVCRWGGEKFVVLLPNTDISGGVRATEKVLLAVSEERFTPAEGKPFFVTFSAGVLRVHQKAPMEDAISVAEGLLYRAKSDGGNRVASPEVGTDSAREKILLADDDKLIVNIVRHRLEKEGLVVHSFPDGISALENAEEIMADLAILDVKMPGMDGFELLRRLRMLPPYARTPIIMLTSMGREQDIVRGFKLGADDYVLKPFSVVELLARVYRLLSVGKGASQD